MAEEKRLSLRLPRPGETGGIRISWHNIRTYLQCPYLWYVENIAPHPDGGVGYRGRYASRAPFVGALVHAGRQAWLETGWQDGHFDIEAGLVGLTADAENRREHVASEDDWAKWTSEATAILERHMDFCATDGVDPEWERYRIASFTDATGTHPMLELEFEVDLGYRGYLWTSRLDAVGHRCDDDVLSSIECKTVDASRAIAEAAAKQLDPQLTGEQFALAEVWPDQRTGVVLDHIVKRAAADKPPRRWHVQDRDAARLERFRIQIVRTLKDIDRDVEEYRDLMAKGLPEEDAARMAFNNQVPGDRCARPGYTCMAHSVCDLSYHVSAMGALTKPKYPPAAPADPVLLGEGESIVKPKPVEYEVEE